MKAKKYIALICIHLLSSFVYCQTNSQNYVLTNTYLTPTQNSIQNPEVSQVNQSITYLDGLGRPIQQIQVKMGHNGKNIVTPFVYDSYNREAKKYLPYVSSSSDLSFLSNAEQELLQYPPYQNQYPYSETLFDNSPLNRIVKISAPGVDWKMDSGHEIKKDVKLNNLDDKIFRFEVKRDFNSNLGIYEYQLNCMGYYLPNSLNKNITKDENNSGNSSNGVIEEFVDDFERVVLKRAFINNKKIDTYYIYDVVGNLIYVISPKASENFVNISESSTPYIYQKSFPITSVLLDNQDNPVSGGGNMNVVIQNSQITVSFNANWAGNAHFDLDATYPLDAIYPIPDMVIGDVSFFYNGNTKYRLIVENNSLRFLDLTPADPPFEFNSFINSNLVKPLNPTLFQNIISYNFSINYSLIDSLCYQYKYSIDNLLLEKKLPGKQWEFLVYDKLNRLVANGPVFNPYGNNTLGWLFSRYDNLGRIVYTLWTEDNSIDVQRRAQLQDEYNNTLHLHEDLSGSNIDNFAIPYSSNCIPQNNYLLLTVNYYDNYSFSHAPNPLPNDVLGQIVLSNCKGLQTGSWSRVLTDPGNTLGEAQYILYDNKERVLKTYSQNYLGGYQSIEYSLDFSGKINQTITTHRLSNLHNIVNVSEKFSYSPEGRLIVHEHQVNNQAPELISHNIFDPLGQLIRKEVGGHDFSTLQGLQSVDYRYNIRGWLTDINNVGTLAQSGRPHDLFAFKINYNQVEENTANGVVPLYNGNISETYWRSYNDNVLRNYGYTYDALNRLEEAFYQKPGYTQPNVNNYREKLTYDPNGNITHLWRNGDMDATNFALEIDDLTYTYAPDSNLLLKVTDATAHPAGFRDDATDGNLASDPSDDYAYDALGNMVKDENKTIRSIKYNHLNLPTFIDFGARGTISYLYDATGRKVRKVVQNNVLSQNTVTDYANGFQYENNILQFFPTAEGYASRLTTKFDLLGRLVKIPIEELPEDQFTYVYNYTDHLGNIRLSYAQDPDTQQLKIVEQNHYYPFGLRHTNYSGGKMQVVKEQEFKRMAPTPEELLSYKYKYQGTERQDEMGLNVDSYKYRNYDYAIGRFFNMDRFSEKYTPISPYSHVANNPLKYVEIQGDSIQLIIGRPYKLNGEDHPYGHVALRVYNSKEGYDYVYDFGRYGAVRGMFGQTGDGILNIYDDSAAYFKTEQSIRESIGYSKYSTVAEDKKIIDYYNKLASSGTRYKKGDRSHRKSYKLPDDYDITDNNCCTVSASGLGLIGENWIGDEYDPRDALSFLESNYKKLGLSRTVYKVGGITVTTYTPKPPKPKPEPKKEEKKKEEKKKEEKKKK